MTERYKDWMVWIADGGAEEATRHLGYNPSGCENCSYGIVSEPDTSLIPGPMYLKRCIAASYGAILFCECEAGKHAEAYIGTQLAKLPAQYLRPNRGILLRERDDGTAAWMNGSSAHNYISQGFVQAVVTAIEEPPPMHAAEDEIEF